MTEHKTPLEHALDLVVYGPLGLALTATEDLPRMVEKGRNRIMLARMIGEHASRHGQRLASQAVKQSAQTLVDLGILPAAPRRSGSHTQKAPSSPAAASDPAATETVTPTPDRTDGDGRIGQPGPGPAPASADLAIPGYDSLSASQVVQRLAGLAADELEAVGSYEAAERGRRTILNKVAQLQAGRP